MFIFGLILALYLICSTIFPLPLSRMAKAGFAVIVLAIALKFHLLNLIGGPMFFAPELPAPVLLVAAWLFAVLFLFFFFVVAADIVRGLFQLICLFPAMKKREKRPSLRNKTNLVLLVLSAVLTTGGIIEGTKVPVIWERDVFFPNLPEKAEGMKIAVLADLHVDSLTRASRIEKIVRRTNGLKPDITVIVGDFVDGSVSLRGDDLLPLENLYARYGVYGVPGNHEYYSGYESWMEFLSERGICMLRNEHVLPGQGEIVLAGVTDLAAGRMGKELPNIKKALAGVSDDTFKILLAHQPKLAADVAREGVDLQISGHTHGGLIKGIDRIVASFNSGFVYGLYPMGEGQLYVSSGSGIWSGFPIRLGVPSEITLLRLRKKTE